MATEGGVQGVSSQQLGPCSLALGRGQHGTATTCSCGPYVAVQPSALRFPAACPPVTGTGATLPLPAPQSVSAVLAPRGCGDALGSAGSEYPGMWFAWGQPPISMGVGEITKQLHQNRDAYCTGALHLPGMQ